MHSLIRSVRIFIVLVMLVARLSAQHIDWVTSHGKTMNGYGGIVSEMAHDQSGHLYSAGNFFGQSAFGTLTLSSNGNSDVFVCKLDAQSGALLWARGFGGPGIDFCTSVSTDTSGDIYICGEIEGTVSFGTYVLNSQGMKDIFIARLDKSNGAVIWAKSFGSRFTDKGKVIKIDNQDHLFLGGDFSDTLTMGSTTLTCPYQVPGTIYSFISRIDKANGNVLWAKQVSAGACLLNALAVDNQGNAFIGGWFWTSVTLGSYVLSAPGTFYEYFIAKLDVNGNFTWAKGSSLQKDMTVYSMCFSNGDLYATGAATPSSPWEVFILKCSAQDGSLGWLNMYSANGAVNMRGKSIAADNAGNIYCTGEYTGPVSFGPFQLGSSMSDLFVFRLNSSGTITGGLNYGGPKTDGGTAITTDGAGTVYFAGSVCNTVSIEHHVITAGAPFQGSYASVGFVAKIKQLVTGIERQLPEDGKNFTLQPNPCQSQVSIQTPLQEDYELSITDARGMKVLYLRNGAEHKTIDLATLSAGVYFVQCTYKNGSSLVKKLVKE